jgi:hypothetical protein
MDGPPVKKGPIQIDPVEHVDIFEPVDSNDSAVSIGVPYIEFEERVHSRSAPHELSSYELGKTVKKILEVESPIHQEELARRVAKAYGLEKAGNRIQSATLKALNVANGLIRTGEFWKSENCSVSRVRVRGDVKSKTLLSAKYLPPEEILFAINYLVKQSVSIQEAELIQKTARLLGFSRCGPDLKALIELQITSEKGKTLNNLNGYISLKNN